jgi:hypothetical protein
MAFFLSFEVPIILRGRPAVVRVIDHYVSDGDLNDDGELMPEEIVFNYKVFDVEEDAEIMQLSADEQQEIYKKVLEDLQAICEE